MKKEFRTFQGSLCRALMLVFSMNILFRVPICRPNPNEDQTGKRDAVKHLALAEIFFVRFGRFVFAEVVVIIIVVVVENARLISEARGPRPHTFPPPSLSRRVWAGKFKNAAWFCWLLHLLVPDELDLRLRELSDLFAGCVEVLLPVLEERVEVVPVLLGEGAVHGGGDLHGLVLLVQLRAHQLRLQDWKEEGKGGMK